ncbi:hypothetical protein WJX75_006776 [Coccomyxa subellipsoidea]|uniref:DNA 3'-5' helicase n=1 Tax=Coccomyxa subellipsoidea TaxID=248742 RepID=A0ABR2YYQ7_9CHLO
MASRIVSFEALQTLLLEYWNTEGFRPLQQEAVEALLEGKDVLLFLPTGGGKSLCFQLPPLCQPHAVTVVVSPLISLAKDQVDAALDRGIDCEVFNSTVSESKKAAIISELCSGILSTKLLYTTPESLALPQLKDALKEAHAACTLRFAIDEAHCISSWGHDFRPAYLSLSSLHTEFPGAPILACTATATKQVKTSIIELLHLKSPVVLESSFNRSNLRYEVRYKDLICDGSDAAAFQDLEAFVKSQAPGTCGIIYAHQRKTCDWLASSLCNVEVDAMAYHAGKDSGQRASIQSQWLEGDVDIVVATIAFGMGVDKADVRWIVHWDAPSSLEAFSQESGRAGRDGLPSLCIMYASKAHFEQMRKLERGERSGSAAGMADMALSACCRRKAVLEHFGEHRGRCNAAEEEACDFCQSPKQVAAAVARLEGAWEHKQAEAAQMEKDGHQLAAGSITDWDTCWES